MPTKQALGAPPTPRLETLSITLLLFPASYSGAQGIHGELRPPRKRVM